MSSTRRCLARCSRHSSGEAAPRYSCVPLALQTEPEQLGEHLRLVEDQRNVLVVSAASSWEITIKYQLGKLPLPEAPERYVPERIRAIGAEAAPVERPHAPAVSNLPPIHRDPFDRLPVAQATLLDLTIMTADPAITEYPVATILVSHT
jgi:PIN domain nuclease of toxin-antitoxin system